ncbi:MAG: FHA domain-containing protein [Planctomycetota bacterium]
MLKLRLLTGPRAGRQIRISDTKPVSIGRRKGRLRLHDSRVSKNHAEIYFENDLWLLKDLGSANGTFVNRQEVDGLAELEPGDLVQMGRVLIKVVRCDGIGMDTAPELPDELLGDDALGIGPLDTEGIEADGELDLSSMFEGEQSPDPLDDSDEFPALSEPANTAIENRSATPEPGIDQPADDEESFFADLGTAGPPTGSAELTDSEAKTETVGIDSVSGPLSEYAETLGPDGEASVDAALSPEEVDTPDENDPFLVGEEEEIDDTSDQISLDDESGMGSRSAGTTLLTSVSHEDLVREDDEIEVEQAEAEPPVVDEDGSDDADEEAPALVGLHLDHAPPQQPDVAEDPGLSTKAEPGVDDATTGHEKPAAEESDVGKPVLEAQEETLETAAELESKPERESSNETVQDDSDQAAFAGLEARGALTEDRETETVDQEPVEEAVSQLEDEHDPLETLANALSSDEQASPIPGTDEATDRDDTEPGAEQAFDITEPINLDEEIEDLITPGAEGPLSEIGVPADATVSDNAAADDVQETAAEADAPTVIEGGAGVETEPIPGPEAEEEAEQTAGAAGVFDDDAPEFDIDAAFDALSEGLDDSVESPAIGADLEDQAPEPAAEQSDGAAEAADPLVGSQLDVGFIKDALSKLEEENQAEAEPPTDDTQPKASAAQPATMPPASTADQYLQSPPPGLNPSSLNPPEEPSRSYAPYTYRSNTGRWFLILLLMLGVGGMGGWLISQNYEKWIAGREDAPPVTPDTPAATPTGVNAPAKPDNQPASEEAWPLTQEQPLSDRNRSDASPSPQTAGPDPFGDGPGLLGSDAVKGLTRDSGDDRPLDPPQPPSNANRTTPDPIRQPTGVPGGSDRTTTNPSIDSTPTLQPSTDNTASEQPPARIVFLVDASGSLIDSLPQMLVWLNRALQTVEADERFAIYFFKAGEPISIKPEGMLAPSREVLNQINKDWLDPNSAPIFPSGRSNPSDAIAAALKLEPTDIYLLSDNAFAAHQGDTTPEQALSLVKQALGDSEARVHGVQFFYRGDNSVLETLANQTDGTFEFVRGRVAPDADPIDLLEELGE